MSRNRIEANTRVFSKLDNFCVSSDVTLATLGNPRWIATRSRDRYVLDHLKFEEKTKLSGAKYLSFAELDHTKLIISSDFSIADPPSGFEEIEVGPGHLTAILAEIPIPISASSYEVKDVVDLHDNTSEGYNGHDHNQVASLFPRIRIFSSNNDLIGPWNSFFKICVEERSIGHEALDADLRQDLIALAELDPNRLPYRVMCRSIFDSDPSSLFLALYRCLESLYSFSSARELGRRFQLDKSWLEIAATVEDVTGWYPREVSSLERLLRMASQADLVRLVSAAGAEVAAGKSPSEKAASVIYSIRNDAVHYRPSQQMSDLDNLNWPEICLNMVGTILDVYVEAAYSA